jgi:hypothetical protein
MKSKKKVSSYSRSRVYWTGKHKYLARAAGGTHMSGYGSNITYYTPDDTTLHRPLVTDARFTFGGMVVCSLPGHSARFSFGGLCSGVWRVICVVVPYSKHLPRSGRRPYVYRGTGKYSVFITYARPKRKKFGMTQA